MWYYEHRATDLRHHKPVRWRFRRIEQRIGVPDVVDVIDPELRMFEEVRRLIVDLDGVVRVESIEIEHFPFMYGPNVLQ